MQLLVRNRNLKPKISKIQSDQWTNKKIIITNSIQNPSIRILLLIKTLILNQLKKKKKTSGLSGLVGLALRPLRETMQACDGAMKSLRSPIRSVAENFSDISFSFFFSKFANSIRDFNPPYSPSFFFVFRVPEATEFRYREREKGENWKEGKERRVGSEAVNLRESWKGKVIIVCETITCEEAEILSWDIFCRTNEVWYFCWKKKVKKRLLVWSCGPPRRVWNLSLGKARVRHSPLPLTLLWW